MGQYALVTGVTSSTGYELVKLIAAYGYDLVIAAGNQDGLYHIEKNLSEYVVEVPTASKNLFHKKRSVRQI